MCPNIYLKCLFFSFIYFLSSLLFSFSSLLCVFLFFFSLFTWPISAMHCSILHLNHYWNLINCLFQMFISLPLFHIMVPFTFDFRSKSNQTKNLANTTLFPMEWTFHRRTTKKQCSYKIKQKGEEGKQQIERKETNTTFDPPYKTHPMYSMSSQWGKIHWK